MPNASAPKAPWVAVWESPQTIVMPGWVRPSSGPITWTSPWLALPVPYSGMPWARQFSPSRWIWAAHAQAAGGGPGERLRRGRLVDQVEVHGEEAGVARGLADHVPVPQLGEQGPRGGYWHGLVSRPTRR